MVIEFDEATYHVQDIGFLGEPVQVYGASGKDMEVGAHCVLPAAPCRLIYICFLFTITAIIISIYSGNETRV